MNTRTSQSTTIPITGLFSALAFAICFAGSVLQAAPAAAASDNLPTGRQATAIVNRLEPALLGFATQAA